jgi:hypothetical protein
MKTLEILIQNITWSVPKSLLFEHDGKFVLKRRAKGGEVILNGVIIPQDNKKKLLLFRQIVRCVRQGIATLNAKYLLTHDNRVIKNTENTVNQFQTGGYSVKRNIVKRKRRLPNDETSMEKKRKLDEDFSLEWLFIVHVTPYGQCGVLHRVCHSF